MPVRILIVDDHGIVREGLRMLLSEEDDIEVVGEAQNGREAVRVARDLQPDVILMDLVMPEMDGIAATQAILQTNPNCRILILTSFSEDQRVPDALNAGATSYLLKDVLKPELLRAIRAAAKGEPTLHPEAQRQLIRQVTAPPSTNHLQNLTKREMDVLRLIAKGYSNKEIAAALYLTEGTVKGYVSTILGKLKVADRTQAALYAVKHGIE